MATESQRQANRQNSRHSTGPKTAGGKVASRANATKHGLSGHGVFDEGELKTLTESALAAGYSAVAAEEVARAVLEHRRVMLSYHEVCTQDRERYVSRGQLGGVMRNTTGESLLGLERYLRRSSSRLLKAVRLA